MTIRLWLYIGAAVIAPAGFAGTAHAQAATCDNSFGADGDSYAAGEDTKNVACGVYANAHGSRNTAIGRDSDASGGNTSDPVDLANGGNTAVGATAKASGSQSFNVSIGSGEVIGLNVSAAGPDASGDNSNNLAIGNTANASGSGSGNIAFGSGATANGNNSARIAIGNDAVAGGNNGVSLGYNAQATGDFSVAIGAGSVAGEDRTVSVGSAGNERRITNVAAGNIAAGSTDAVNGDQLYNASLDASTALATANAAQLTATGARQTADTALANAATAQGTANTALGKATTAQGTADTALTTANVAIVRGDTLGNSTATALGGGAAYNPATGGVSAPAYAIGGTTYNNVGGAFAAVNSQLTTLSTRVDGMINLVYDIRKEERRGIAAAVAMATAPMPSEPGRVSWATNTALFRGEVAFGGSVAARVGTKVPLAITAGFAYAAGGNNTARVGLAGEF